MILAPEISIWEHNFKFFHCSFANFWVFVPADKIQQDFFDILQLVKLVDCVWLDLKAYVEKFQKIIDELALDRTYKIAVIGLFNLEISLVRQ